MTIVGNVTERDDMRRSLLEEAYYEFMDLKPDPRVENWPLMDSLWPTVIICMIYVIVVKLIGPWAMKNREPFKLRRVLVVYNGVLVILSTWIFLRVVGRDAWFGKYSFTCEPVDYSQSEVALAIAASCWWYFMTKFIEFLDTIFFVLRKKDSHISVLHVFHHGMMPMGTWLAVKYVPGGHTTFPGMLNCFVHMIMYFYYMLAAMGPAYEKFIWWKKYLTVIQLIQFIAVTIHNIQLLFIPCNYPKVFVFIYLINALIFLSMFSNFYRKSYKKSRNFNNSFDKITSVNESTYEKKLKSG